MIIKEDLQKQLEEAQQQINDLYKELDDVNKGLIALYVENEQNFRNVIYSSTDGILVVDKNGSILFANPSAQTILGRESEDLEGKTIGFPLLVDEETEIETTGKNGNRTIAEIKVVDVEWEGKPAYLLTLRDITERTQMEQQKELYLEVLSSMSEHIHLRDAISDVIALLKDFSDCDAVAIRLREGKDYPYYETNGFDEEFVLKENPLCAQDVDGKILTDDKGNPILECMCGKVIGGHTETNTSFFTSGGSFWTNSTSDLIASTIEKDPQTRTIKSCNEGGYESIALIPIGATEEKIGLLQLNSFKRNHFNIDLIRFYEGIAQSIGAFLERKLAEEKVRQAVAEWRGTFDSITDFISIHDKDFRIVRVNKAAVSFLNKQPEELIGRKCYEVFHGSNKPIPNCPHMKALKNNKTASDDFYEPHLGIHLELTASPILNDEGEATASVHVTRDITERKSIQEQLMLADRLASIGQLAAGIAHELNNPLAGVMGISKLLLEKDVPDDIKQELEIINNEAERAANVVRGLLTFARNKGDEKGPVNIDNIIQDVLQLRSYEQRVSNIQVETRFAPDLPQIIANGAQMQQVFVNLIVNAEQAMLEAHNKGKIEVAIEKIENMVRISISDDGPGISPENMKRLFNPFFTTKDIGKGTGLGLSICHGIVTEHGGKLSANSEPGKGATFIIELPIPI